MKPIAITVPGSVITNDTAAEYLHRIAKMLQQDLTIEKSVVLSEIEDRIVRAGFLNWEQVEEIEISAL